MTETPAPEPRLCIVCGDVDLGLTVPQTCDGCVMRSRFDLNAVIDGYTVLPNHLHAYASQSPGTGEGGSRNAETPLMGGDVLSLIGYGGDAPGTGLPSDPPSILFELERWEDDWRHARGVQAAPARATISNVSAYLNDNLGWAAQHHPAYDEFAGDMRRLRGHVERATGTADRPVFANAPCIDCGGRLARRWTTSGLEDDWTCLGCRRVYTETDYYLAIEQHQTDRQREIA